MKRSAFIFITLLSLNIEGSIDTIRSESKITDVTVFFNGAQIIRDINVKTGKGKHLIVLKELPDEINPKSIQVYGLENCTILSVKHQTVHPTFNKEIKAEFDNKIEKQELRVKEIKNKINVYEIEEKILLSNSQVNKKDESISITEIKEAAEFYRIRLNEIRREILNLSEELKNIQKETQELYVVQNKLTVKDRKIYSNIFITIDCKKDINENLIISYYVPSAGWVPLYDFRVDEITEPLRIVYNANVYQSSGENWDNVNLTLSSNDPLLSGYKPQIITWYVDRNSPYQKGNIRKTYGSMTGRVSDKEAFEPIPFANIVIKRNNEIVNSTITDFDGQYTIKPIESGTYDLEISFLGYKSVRINGIRVT